MNDRICGAVCLVALLAATLRAEEPAPVVVAELKHPTAIVAAPGGEMFVLDSGAGKLIRFKNDKPTDVVTGYSAAVVKPFGEYRLGPLSAAVLPGDAILIGDAAESEDGLIRVFPWFKDTAFERKNQKDKIGPLIFTAPRKENWITGLATTPEAIFAVCHNGKTPRGIARASINGTKFGPLERWAEGAENDEFNPTAIVIHPEEGHVVVARQDVSGNSHDSRLTIYNRQSAKPLLDLRIGLFDVNGLAYSPKTGLLFATDLSWQKPEECGLFRLDATFGDEGQSIKPMRIATLERPTALAFAEDGSLWVTLLGKKDTGGGSVVRFKAGL